MITLNKTCIENQLIFVATRKNLGVGGWGLDIPYGVRILNPLEIIGRSLTCSILKLNLKRGGDSFAPCSPIGDIQGKHQLSMGKRGVLKTYCRVPPTIGLHDTVV